MMNAKERDTHLVTARIEYVEVTHAGQAFRLGRYPIHYHLNGNVTGNYVRGCGIHHTFNRAVTIHAVDYLLVERNVAYNNMGHAYFTEDGIETNNIIQYNLAIFTRSSNSLLNVDVTPASYWIVNPDNIVRHNAAAGGSHFAFWYNPPEHPGGPSYTTSICPRNVPVQEFTNNTAHSFGWYGLWIFPVYYPMEGGTCDSAVSAPTVFNGLAAWNCGRGAEVGEVGPVQFHNFITVNNAEAGIEMQTTNDRWGGPLIKDSTIVGWSALSESKSDECTTAGLKLPKSPYLTVDSVKFFNFDQDRCAAIRACSHCKPYQGGFEARFKNIGFFNAPNKAGFQWQHEGWLTDMDGTLRESGAPGTNYKVLPNNPNLPSDHCDTANMEAYSTGDVAGAVCDDTVDFHRFAFNNFQPDSFLGKDALFENAEGTSTVPFKKKRITHPNGWMLTLINGDTYTMFFDKAGQITNISFSGRFDFFGQQDFVLMKHNLTQTPDRFSIVGDDRNATAAVPTYAANTNGDWHFDKSLKEFTYLSK